MMTATSTSATRHGLPAQLLIEEVVRRQERQQPRTRLERMLGRSPIGEKDLAWYRGAKGELLVGELLERLPEGWRVLHSLPIGHAADLDHVLIGPAGVFVLNTKHHAGKRVWTAGNALLVNGIRHAYIEKAQREGVRLIGTMAGTGAFGIDVTPVIVLVGVASLTVREEPKVPVVRAERLVRWLRSLPRVLEQDVVDELARRLSKEGVWAESADPVPDARVRFAELDGEVDRARLVRGAWAAGLAVGTAGVGMLLGNLALTGITAALGG
ncbi:nuclease-related domain-containing protein [Naasia sp. SYSU D00948]|uniref:nuclease-related domain-containing protein n=1 Tax=Naasia sp. SYSU D00948 TaxID=2817379 RepID=UPI001B315CF7|nr:nuclease-related domain-containing protein [Naasia sp. SYSU D00948]